MIKTDPHRVEITGVKRSVTTNMLEDRLYIQALNYQTTHHHIPGDYNMNLHYHKQHAGIAQLG
jgi:hypothetical protein